MKQTNIDKLVCEVLAIEEEAAKEACALGSTAKALVQATLPHRNPGDVGLWSRTNGSISLIIQSGFVINDGKPKSIGLPYGTIPRLLIAWISTEVIKKKSNIIRLGSSLSDFMEQMNVARGGGKTGGTTRLKEQMQRLFSSRITYSCNNSETFAFQNITIADKTVLWWDPKEPDQATWDSWIQLHDEFYQNILNAPVPIDLRAIKALKQSPLALDIYCWLTYRMSYLKKKTMIPWEALQKQFGADYASGQHGKRDFKRAFVRELKKVLLLYPAAKLACETNHLLLEPSKTHIARW
jgi:hypothetical protein